MRRIIIGSVAVLGLVLGTGSAAFAGETTGNGKPVPRQGTPASLCHFSGQDLPDSVEHNPPGFDDDWLTIHGVQNYGQYVSQGYKGEVPKPGIACNPTKGFEE